MSEIGKGITVIGIIVILEVLCVWFLWKGPNEISVSMEPATPGAIPSTNATWNSFAATNASLQSVLEALNTTRCTFLDEGLVPQVRVNVQVSWKGWRRTWHAYPEGDPIMKRLVEICEEKYGGTLYMLNMPTTTYALTRLSGTPFRLEVSNASSYSFSCRGTEWKGIANMRTLTQQLAWRLGVASIRDDTGLTGKYVVNFHFAGEAPRFVISELTNAGLTLVSKQTDRDVLVYRPVAIDTVGNVILKKPPRPEVGIEPAYRASDLTKH